MTDIRVKCYQCGNWVLPRHIHKESFKMGAEPREVDICTSCWLIIKRVDESLESKELEVRVIHETENT
jgi:hypothetical protein